MPSEHILILATQEGILRIPMRPDGSLGPFEQTLHGTGLEAVSQDSSGTLYAGDDKGRIYRSQNGGEKWQQVFEGFPNTRGLWSLVAHPIRSREIYAGMEPASLWISRDGGNHWNELTALRNHPAAKHWHFYNPMKPHIRAIAFDRRGERIYIGIEVGGILSSQDGGGSFEDIGHGVDEDVHTIQVSQDNPDHLFAMTGGGLFRSQNGGHQWEKLTRGLNRWYMVPLVFVSNQSSTLCVGAGNTPPPAWRTRGADAAIYRSEDGGDQWSMANGPFPLRGMPSSIISDPDNPHHLFTATSNGMILRSTDGGKRWSVEAEELPRIEEMLISQR